MKDKLTSFTLSTYAPLSFRMPNCDIAGAYSLTNLFSILGGIFLYPMGKGGMEMYTLIEKYFHED